MISDKQKQRMMEESALAQQAKDLSDHPAVNVFLRDSEKVIFDEWVNSTDIDDREDLHQKITLLRGFKTFIETSIGRGNQIEKQIKQWGSQ
jgi:hypothetical protein